MSNLLPCENVDEDVDLIKVLVKFWNSRVKRRGRRNQNGGAATMHQQAMAVQGRCGREGCPSHWGGLGDLPQEILKLRCPKKTFAQGGSKL